MTTCRHGQRTDECGICRQMVELMKRRMTMQDRPDPAKQPAVQQAARTYVERATVIRCLSCGAEMKPGDDWCINIRYGRYCGRLAPKYSRK